MTILSLDDLVASVKQQVLINKLASMTGVAAQWFSPFALAGNPGAGTLAGSSTAAGVVPTDAVSGYPVINAFGGGAKGHIAAVEYGSSVACRIALYDRLFCAGAYAFNANTNLASQPSYASRVPGGTDFKGLELWLEQVTAGTGVQGVNVGYLDQDGNAGSTGVFATAANIVGRCTQLPLAAGDSGVSRVDSVVGSTASVGTFNINVLRPLWSGRVRFVNDGGIDDFLKTGLPEIFPDSALYIMVAPDSTATGLPDLGITVANK